MKARIVLIISLSFLQLVFYAQFNCGNYTIESQLLVSDANYAQRKQLNQQQLQDSIAAHHSDSLFLGRNSDISVGVIKVPVVVHLIGDLVISNVSINTIQNRIAMLNNEYRKIIGGDGYGDGVDTEIQFCLAPKDPSGNPTTGVIYKYGLLGPYCTNSESTFKNLSNWPATDYLNIWVCDLTGCGLHGWGTPPAMHMGTNHQVLDGVVIDMSLFDSKALAHEIGHWLDLLHTYGKDGSQCGTSDNDDHCDDTPWCSGSNHSDPAFSCTPKPQQCTTQNGNPTDRQIENYMDDSKPDCMNMFTAKQKLRMQMCLNNVRPGILVSPGGCQTCNNQIQDPDETGVDCGGVCPPCSPAPPCAPWTVEFNINGQGTSGGKFINVCKDYGSIILSPKRKCPTVLSWDRSVATRNYLDNPDPNGWGCQNMYYHPSKLTCNVDVMYISIENTDESRNRMPNTELGKWFDMAHSVTSTGQSLNLHDYLYYLGNPLQDGGYYRITIACGDAKTWRSYSAFIKVYENNLTITNKSISKSEVSDNITINNCYVAGGLDLNIVAKNSISITPNTEVHNRVNFFIQNFSCGQQISSYRPMADGQSKGQFSNEAYASVNSQPAKAKGETKLEEDKVLIVPNPSSTGIFKVSSATDKKVTKVIVLNLTGQVIDTFDSETIDITKYSQGVYFAEVFFEGRKITKKLIYQ